MFGIGSLETCAGLLIIRLDCWGTVLIIVRIIGGLGNQMFQYAFGRAVSEEFGVDLYLDTSSYDTYSLHNGYELERVFGIDSPVASTLDLRQILGWRASRFGRRILSKSQLKFLWGRNYYTVVDASFNCDNAYFAGFWQSEKYFNSIKSLLREEFQFAQATTGENKRYQEEILSCQGAVSIHVRRGDYVSNNRTNQVHGTCGLGYYERAMQHIQQFVDDPVYYVFSDDPDWVSENLKIDNECYFIRNNFGSDSYNDMRLMSYCKHNIIANSSFSWWGGWLNKNEDKIVIAPSQWFNDASREANDLIPENWLRL